jgi:hypothetical protein
VARYANRSGRHPGHLPPDAETLERIRRAAPLLEPLGVGEPLRLDTSRPVDVTRLVERIIAGRVLLAEAGDDARGSARGPHHEDAPAGGDPPRDR